MLDTAVSGVAPDGKKSFRESLRAFLKYEPSSRIKPQEIVLFCRQLASFVRVGVPVTAAIETFAEQATSARMRSVYTALGNDIQKGVRLSDAFAAHPRAFPRIVSDMVRSAEATGNLDVVLLQASRHIEREASARSKVRGAMIYPVIIATLAIVITTGIVVFVLPQFRTLYQSLNVPLPPLLRAVLGGSAFISDHAIAILLGILAIVLGVGYGLRTEAGKYWRDRLVVRMPVIGPLVRTATTERFCRTLGDMLAAGVPISQTYVVVMSNIRNRVYRDALMPVGPALASGQGMYQPIQAAHIFPSAVIQMMRVGEETGHLDANLTEAANMYEEDLDYLLKRMTSYLEPILIVFVGIMVGFVAITMITSIYSLAGNFH
jgi:type IV pilus assembly protein PilC